MRSFILSEKSKSFVSSVFLVGLVSSVVACSGHKFGDPTQGYGDMKGLATDPALEKDQISPTYTVQTDIEALGDLRFQEGQLAEFKVEVGFPLRAQHDLRVFAPNDDNIRFDVQRATQRGGRTTWEVKWEIPQSFLPMNEVSRDIEIKMVVEFRDPADASVARAIENRIDRHVERLTVSRRSTVASLRDVSVASDAIVEERVPVKVIVDPRGTSLSDPPKLEMALVRVGCQASVRGDCFLPGERVWVADFNPSIDEFISESSLRVRAEDFAENEDYLDLILVVRLRSSNPADRTLLGEVRHSINIRKPEKLAAPLVSLVSSEEDLKISQGESVDIEILAEANGELGVMKLDSDFSDESLESSFPGLSLQCDDVSGGKVSCFVSGGTSCDTVTGNYSPVVRFVVENEGQLEATELAIPIEIMPSGDCNE